MKRYFRSFNKIFFRKLVLFLLTIFIFHTLIGVAFAQDEQVIHPNKFVLNGENFFVTYSTTSLIGVPMLTYRASQKVLTFSGNDIRVLHSEIGDQVTVTIHAIPDLLSVTLTIIIPVINLPGTKQVQFWTKAIFTTHKTSIGGPDLINGAIQSYRFEAVLGKASFVIF